MARMSSCSLFTLIWRFEFVLNMFDYPVIKKFATFTFMIRIRSFIYIMRELLIFPRNTTVRINYKN